MQIGLVEEIGTDMLNRYGSTADIEFSNIEQEVAEYMDLDLDNENDEDFIYDIALKVDLWLIANGE